MIKYIKYKESFSDFSHTYLKINDKNLVHLDLDDNGNLFEDKNGYIEGIKINNKWITSNNAEVWQEVDFQEIDIKLNYYGYGIDKVTAIIEGSSVELVESKWEGNTNCYIPSSSVNFDRKCI